MKEKIRTIFETVIFIFIFIPLVIITIRISYQSIMYPKKIPDIFGYKFFIVLDENMDNSLNYGDLVFTYNKNASDLKENDVIAYRNDSYTVTIHKINKITENDISNNQNKKKFLIDISSNKSIVRNISEENIEGIVVNRIPRIGAFIYFLQQPLMIFVISCSIVIVGRIWIIFAGKLDKKELQKLESQNKEINID